MVLGNEIAKTYSRHNANKNASKLGKDQLLKTTKNRSINNEHMDFMDLYVSKRKNDNINKIEPDSWYEKKKNIKKSDNSYKFKTKYYSNGKYVGEYFGDKKNGQGTFTWSGGNQYFGEWRNDKKHGQGTFFWTNGDKYVGEWKDDKKDGRGSYSWSDGDKYIGEYLNGKRHGQGTFIGVNGDRYIGEWRNNKRYR